MKFRSLLLLAALGILAAACTSKDKKVDQPVKLTDIANPTVRIQRLWGASVGGGGKKMRLGLGLATADNRLFAAGPDGDVAAFDLKTGKQIWRTKTELAARGWHWRRQRRRRRRLGRRRGGHARGRQRRAALARERQWRNPVLARGGGKGSRRAHRRRQAARAVDRKRHGDLGGRTADSAPHAARRVRVRSWRATWRFPASTMAVCSR